MKKKIFRSMIALTVTVLLTAIVVISTFLHDYFNEAQVQQLKEALSLEAYSVEQGGENELQHLSSQVFRFTLVAPDGTVLYDTQAEPDTMGNHGDRKEIREAMETGTGSSARYSATLMQKTFYEATLLEDGKVLRIAGDQVTLGALLLQMLPLLCAILLISAAVALLLSGRMAKSIVQPLERLDLEHPGENETYEEVRPILTKLSRQRQQIQNQMQELRQKSDEFQQITASMNEGLVLLDKRGMILSLNSAAQRLFSVDQSAVGRDFLVVERSTQMSRAVVKAQSGCRSEFRERRNGGEYQFIINRIQSDGKAMGVVILCLDVTETAFAEQNRREFTANVSHELKTPLQSIIGSAELLESGLVRPEDQSRFVGNIKTEAQRLVTLINDIIALSQLDEAQEVPRESVELLALSEEVAESLRGTADQKQVTIVCKGEPVTMSGVRRYLYEVIYNLMDNAIRYNRPGGTVTVTVGERQGNTILSVEDTGIGIPPEHQSRIFERFYRVDKSHSKETGGTGLGLSIVKHAVGYHGGSIQLDSTPGAGTKITVTF